MNTDRTNALAVALLEFNEAGPIPESLAASARFINESEHGFCYDDGDDRQWTRWEDIRLNEEQLAQVVARAEELRTYAGR